MREEQAPEGGEGSGRGALFEPSLQGQSPPPSAGAPPWRLESQFAVAFFGGAGALTTIAFLNARRLGMDRAARTQVLVVGLAGWTLALAAGAFAGRGIGYTVAAIATWAVLRARQREADRRYHYFGHGDESYGSLWGPGLAAVLGFRGLEAVVLYAVLTSL